MNFKCIGCGVCQEICPMDIYVLNEEKKAVPKNMAACLGCELCKENCPEHCIMVQKQQ